MMFRVVYFVLCLCLATASLPPSPDATTAAPSSATTGGTSGSDSGYTIQAEGNHPFIEFAVDNVTQLPFLESQLLTLAAKRQQLFERLNTSLGRVEALDLEWMDINQAAHTTSGNSNSNTDTASDTAAAPAASASAEEYFSLVLNETIHGFVAAVWRAYTFHRPLVLKADHIWQVILEGFARHVDSNAEYLRERFVTFEGKKELLVRRDDIVLGEDGNDWASVLADFASQIRNNTHADVYGAVVGDPFATSTSLDMLLRNIALMNSQKRYFEYTGFVGCGFPSIRLEGVRADYVALRERVERLAPFLTEGFQESWIPALRSVLDEFVKVWDGQIDRHFWSSMIKFNRFPPAYFVEDRFSGWINALFPYTAKNVSNGYAVPWPEMRAEMQRFDQLEQEQPQDTDLLSFSAFGMAAAEFAPFEHKVPVKWLAPLSGRQFELNLLGGFSSPLIHAASGAVRPASVWSLVRVSETSIPPPAHVSETPSHPRTECETVYL